LTWTATYSQDSATSIAWQQLSSVTDSAGVDFELKVNDQYPLEVNDNRPCYLVDQEEKI
jgi:hypothetical protein